MDNESSMNQSVAQYEVQNVNILRQSLSLVQAKIGRDLEREEVQAIGFVLDRLKLAKDEQIFVSQILGAGQNPQESKWQIRQKIRGVTETEINRRIADASGQGDNEEIEKLRAIRDGIAGLDAQVEQRYKNGEDFSLGAVPEYFLPEWVKNYR